jgi:hypothetical protein
MVYLNNDDDDDDDFLYIYLLILMNSIISRPNSFQITMMNYN